MYAKNKMEAMSMYDGGENSHLTTKFEFLKNYKECKSVIAREIDRSAKKVVTLKLQLILFQTYLQHPTTELNSFQGYILCDFLKMLGKTTLVKTSDEAMHIYFAFVMYCSAYIQELDLDQVFCVSNKFYVVLFDILMAMNVDNDDLTLFAECLDEITNYFTIAPTPTRKFILIHTFEEGDDAFVTRLKKVYDKHHQSLTWDSIAFRMSNFLYCVGYNYINTGSPIPVPFSHEFITLVTLLVRDGTDDYFNLNMFTLFVALEFYPEPECHSHLNLDFVNYCVFTEIAGEPHAVCKSTMLHSITCVLDQMMIKGFVLPKQNFVEIFQNVYNTIYNVASHSLLAEEQILKFIFAIYKYHNYDLKETGCITFLENIVCDDDVEALLYLQVLFTILKQTAVPSAVLFENMCVNYTSFTFNETSQKLYAAVVCKMMEYDKTYRSILLEYPECLELQCMAYVKYILVYTSLFDKCKLYITENAHQWTRDELREIEHLI